MTRLLFRGERVFETLKQFEVPSRISEGFSSLLVNLFQVSLPKGDELRNAARRIRTRHKCRFRNTVRFNQQIETSIDILEHEHANESNIIFAFRFSVHSELFQGLRRTRRCGEQQLSREIARLFQALIREFEVTDGHCEFAKLFPLGLIRTLSLHDFTSDAKFTQLNGKFKLEVGVSGNAQRVRHQAS